MARHKATAEENGSVDEVAENFTNGHSAEIESAPASEPSSAAVSEDIPEPDTPATSVDSAGSSESTSKGKKANKIDVSSFDAFPSLVLLTSLVLLLLVLGASNLLLNLSELLLSPLDMALKLFVLLPRFKLHPRTSTFLWKSVDLK